MRQVFKVSADEGQDPLFSFGDGNVTARYDVEVSLAGRLLDRARGTAQP